MDNWNFENQEKVQGKELFDKPKPKEIKIEKVVARENGKSTFKTTLLWILFGFLICASVLLYFTYEGYFTPSNDQTCSAVTCPTITCPTVPACPTIPACPSCNCPNVTMPNKFYMVVNSS